MYKATPTYCLSTLHGLLSELESTLRQESEVLGRNDIEALAHLTQEKHALCQKLEQAENELRKIDTAATYKNLPQWNEVVSLFQQCQRHNQCNGIVVIRKRHDVATLLATLHGQNTSERGTYGRSGSSPAAVSRGGDLIASA